MDPITTRAPSHITRTLLSQSWEKLVFIHWRVDAAEIADLMPAGVVPDEFDGSSWVGLIPFEMRKTRALGKIPVPFGSFTEINVRLYGVDARGRRAVVFRSLEASRLAAVVAARAAFGIPYFWAEASLSEHDGVLDYRSRRFAPGRPATRILARPGRESVVADPLADFLTGRWLLFGTHLGHSVAMPNEHEPWPLFTAELLDLDDSLVAASGIRSIGTRAPDSVLYSPGVITRFGGATRLLPS